MFFVEKLTTRVVNILSIVVLFVLLTSCGSSATTSPITSSQAPAAPAVVENYDPPEEDWDPALLYPDEEYREIDRFAGRDDDASLRREAEDRLFDEMYADEIAASATEDAAQREAEELLSESSDQDSLDYLLWDEASDHPGEYKTVCGAVFGTLYAVNEQGQPTFLNIGNDYPNPRRFTVVIWGRDRNNFPSPPETLYNRANICVSGIISLYEGVPEIEVSTPLQITQ